MSYSVRKAIKSDIPAILNLIQELADFENLSYGPKITADDLCRDGGFDDPSSSPLFFCFVAETVHESNNLSRSIIGYAFCFYSYSTWEGKTILLEDLYVQPEYRKNGIGKMLLVHLARHAKEMNCKRIDLHVLGWNPARKFYEKLGASDMTTKEEWHYYRMGEKTIDQLNA